MKRIVLKTDVKKRVVLTPEVKFLESGRFKLGSRTLFISPMDKYTLVRLVDPSSEPDSYFSTGKDYDLDGYTVRYFYDHYKTYHLSLPEDVYPVPKDLVVKFLNFIDAELSEKLEVVLQKRSVKL